MFKEKVFLCFDCCDECNNRGVVFENAPLYQRKGVDFTDPLHPRNIPTEVRQKVWYRDNGKCQICGSKQNLQYDHIIPFSRGGSSLVREKIQLLCDRHNIEKRDKIE